MSHLCNETKRANILSDKMNWTVKFGKQFSESSHYFHWQKGTGRLGSYTSGTESLLYTSFCHLLPQLGRCVRLQLQQGWRAPHINGIFIPITVQRAPVPARPLEGVPARQGPPVQVPDQRPGRRLHQQGWWSFICDIRKGWGKGRKQHSRGHYSSKLADRGGGALKGQIIGDVIYEFDIISNRPLFERTVGVSRRIWSPVVCKVNGAIVLWELLRQRLPVVAASQFKWTICRPSGVRTGHDFVWRQAAVIPPSGQFENEG